jgi:hypothetical protein
MAGRLERVFHASGFTIEFVSTGVKGLLGQVSTMLIKVEFI